MTRSRSAFRSVETVLRAMLSAAPGLPRTNARLLPFMAGTPLALSAALFLIRPPGLDLSVLTLPLLTSWALLLLLSVLRAQVPAVLTWVCAALHLTVALMVNVFFDAMNLGAHRSLLVVLLDLPLLLALIRFSAAGKNSTQNADSGLPAG